MKLRPKHFGQEFVIKNNKEFRVPWAKTQTGEVFASIIDVAKDKVILSGFWGHSSEDLLSLVEGYLTLKEGK